MVTAPPRRRALRGLILCLAVCAVLALLLILRAKEHRRTALRWILAGFGVFGKVVCSFLMLFGRLELLPMFILFTRSAWRKY